MCCVYDGLEPHNHYEPQQDTNNPIRISCTVENYMMLIIVAHVDGLRLSLNCGPQGAFLHPPDDIWAGRATVECLLVRTRRKTCPSATLSTTNPTWTDHGLHGDRPATNHLKHGTVIHKQLTKEQRIRRDCTKPQACSGWQEFSAATGHGKLKFPFHTNKIFTF
jgi:hypothetical protein